MSVDIDDLKTALADYEDLLIFEEIEEYITVKLNKFLHGEHGKAKWSAINEQIKQFGGEWVSAGKQSRWQVKRETPQKPAPPKQSELAEIVDDFERLLTRLRKVAY